MTYSTKPSAIRAARNALAKTGVANALSQVHFTVSGSDAAGWEWVAIDTTPAEPRPAQPKKEAQLAEAETTEKAPFRAECIRSKIFNYLSDHAGTPFTLQQLADVVGPGTTDGTVRGAIEFITKVKGHPVIKAGRGKEATFAL